MCFCADHSSSAAFSSCYFVRILTQGFIWICVCVVVVIVQQKPDSFREVSSMPECFTVQCCWQHCQTRSCVRTSCTACSKQFFISNVLSNVWYEVTNFICMVGGRGGGGGGKVCLPEFVCHVICCGKRSFHGEECERVLAESNTHCGSIFWLDSHNVGFVFKGQVAFCCTFEDRKLMYVAK